MVDAIYLKRGGPRSIWRSEGAFNFPLPYLVILLHLGRPRITKAVLVELIDLSKASNCINHAKVIVRLSDWGVPGWLLKILISYLQGLSMILRYKGVYSSRHMMPGGSPQGALLGFHQSHSHLTLQLLKTEACLELVDDLSLADSIVGSKKCPGNMEF